MVDGDMNRCRPSPHQFIHAHLAIQFRHHHRNPSMMGRHWSRLHAPSLRAIKQHRLLRIARQSNLAAQ
jgi:hypothetical protein